MATVADRRRRSGELAWPFRIPWGLVLWFFHRFR